MPSTLKISPSQTIRGLIRSREVAKAFDFFEVMADAITEEHIRICSIPASPFGEKQRAEYLRDKFLEMGLDEVSIDGEGNCLGHMKGISESLVLVVSAHLDTVFPQGTDFTVQRQRGKYLGPG